jgi:acyl-CoA thioester hydrolase
MNHRFVRRFRVRHYELDAFGHLQGVNLVRYMQEAAIEASADLGFSADWYRERNVGWVVGRLFVRFDSAALYGDEVEVATWLSGLRGVRSFREYDVTFKRSGERVARGRAEWVYMDFQTGQPLRVPDAWADAFLNQGKPEDLGIRLCDAKPTTDAHRHAQRHRVRFHELDTVQHVNHAVYVKWVEQASLDALTTDKQTQSGEGRANFIGHEMQYFAGALDRENIEIISWVCETTEDAIAWTHEIFNVETRKLLARDYARMGFVNARHEPIRPPTHILDDVLRNPNE